MLKVALFDLDGVLVTPKMVFSERMMKEYGVTPEDMSPFFSGVFLECLVGRADLKEEIQKYMKEWGWKGSVGELLDYWFRSESNTDKRVLGVVDDLRNKGVRCYVATNQEKYRVQYIADQMNFKDIFDGIFASFSIGSLKNHPVYFERVLEELDGIHPEEVFFCDDSEDNIEIAKSIGIKTHFYKKFEDFEREISKLI